MTATLETKGVEVLGSWYPIIGDLFISDRMKTVVGVLKSQKSKGLNVLPSTKTIFEVFKELNFDNLKGLVLNDEPYNTANTNIHRALAVDEDFPYSYYPEELIDFMWEWESSMDSGKFTVYEEPDLHFVYKHNILMLNASLTTVEGKPKAHRKLWDWFIAGVLQRISQHKQGVSFLLLGDYSHKFKECITVDDREHTIVEAPHPRSPNFIGSNCFVTAFPFVNP